MCVSPCGARYKQRRLKSKKKKKKKVHHFIKCALTWKETEDKVRPALKIKGELLE